MKKWLALAAAILSEVTGSVSLRAAVDAPAWYVVVVMGFVVAFACLSLSLRHGMALGVGYGIWGACGVVLTAVLAAVIFGEPLTAVMMAGIVLVMAGVLVVELGSQRARAQRKAAE